MKKHPLFCLLLALALCLSAVGACGENMTVVSFFPAANYCHAEIVSPDMPLTFDAVFYEDGSVHGVTDALEEISGYYAVLWDGTLRLGIGSASFSLTADGKGGYTGSWPDGNSACVLTPITRSAFDAAVERAELYVDAQLDRVDASLWDYPMFALVTDPDGIDLLVNHAWPNLSAGHLPAGTMVRILGQWFDDELTENEGYLLEADGVRGFAVNQELESLPTRRAKVVRSSSKDKGRTVNIRSTPDYGDNVVQEVPYGETVDVFPVVRGEFTMVYYDHGEGWMTTIRLKIIDDE